MKYKLTSETLIVEEHTLYRIKSLKDFSNVRKNDLGGFIEKVKNLSQKGNCWVYGCAKIYGNARVYGNAMVHDNARVYGNGRVYGNARVYRNVSVSEDARVYENEVVYGNNIINLTNREFSQTLTKKDIIKKSEEPQLIKPIVTNSILCLEP